MTIKYIENIPNINDYWNLFNDTDWNEEYNFSAYDLDKAISNSWYAISAYFNNNLVGFGRIISDGIHHALIVDMIINKDFQEKGIGKTILLKLINKCKEEDIRDIQLFAAKNKYGFYEKLNFEKRPIDAPGMQLLNNK